jgi:predicted RNA-binding protein Jag
MDASLLKDFVVKFLGLMGVEDASVEVTEGHRTLVKVSCADPSKLIGPHGEHLKAVNMIARRMVEAKHGEEAASFLIDVNDYHEASLEKVRQSARMLAQRARLFKHDVELEPMSAYERLVVHELFSGDPEIRTESAGEGKTRHIVLKYKDSGFVSNG